MAAELDDGSLVAKCENLYPREADVLRRWHDQSAKEIAEELKLSQHTVHGYANDARKKLGAASTREAARLFRRYEALKTPPPNSGGEFQRVVRPAEDDAASGRGFSNSSDLDPKERLVSSEKADVHDTKGLAMPQGIAPEGQGFPKRDRSGGGMRRASRLDRSASLVGQGLLLHGWLARLSSIQWLGLTVLVTLFVIAAFGLATVSLLGVFEVLHQMAPQHR